MKFTFLDYGIKFVNLTKLFQITLKQTVHLKILNRTNGVIKLKTKLCPNVREKTTGQNNLYRISCYVKCSDKNVTFETKYNFKNEFLKTLNTKNFLEHVNLSG